MRIQQYYLACLSHASYMITDEKTKTAAVVDPQRDVDHYLADAAAGGYKAWAAAQPATASVASAVRP